MSEASDTILYSVPKVLEVLSIGRTMLYELFDSGAIVPVKIGRRTFVTRWELERYAASLEAGADWRDAKAPANNRRGQSDRATS